jgi:hypothetical protein
MDRTLNESERDQASPGEFIRTGLLITLLTLGSVFGNLAFACAAPLAAIATVAATKMRAGEGLVLVCAAWLANKLVGYLILDYPQTWESFAWGGAIGIAAALGFVGATVVAKTKMPELTTVAVAFAAAFAVFEASLFAATVLLPSSGEAFSLVIIARIFQINAIALIGLLAVHRAAMALKLLRPAPLADPATT